MTAYPDPEPICEACKKKTRISYKYDGAFFEPKLGKINHLQLGYSSILRNPPLILFERLYQLYQRLRDAWRRFKAWLFPRRDKNWSRHIDSRLTGATVYAHREELGQPIRGLHAQFWARTRWGQWRKLGEAYGDENGRFSLPFDLRAARNWQIGGLHFELYQTNHAYVDGDRPKIVLQRCYTRPLAKSDLIGMDFNLRDIYLCLWEYRQDTPAPRAVIRDLNYDAPQYYAEGRVEALTQQMTPFELIKIKHLEQIAVAPDTLTIEQIQSDYPENLTVCIEKQLKGYTRTDEWFGRRMMNGMNRGAFLPDKDRPDHYWIKYFGLCDYEHNTEYALPTVEIKFQIPKDALPTPLEIHLTGPVNAYDKNPWQKRVFTPADGDQWLYAKRVARVSGAFSTEVDEHFTGTHLNVEQYAVAAYRNFRRGPLAALLFPHLKEVALVNHSADNLLIHQYIPSATALTENGLHARCVDLLGMQDWKHWKPMDVLSDKHTCAKAEQLFWQVVKEFIDGFFEENAEEIKAYWHEVYYFSEDLVNHAVPVFLSDFDWEHADPDTRKLAEDRLEYYAFQYAFDRRAPRRRVNGQLKTVSPITETPDFNNVPPEDWDNLKKVCAYAVMMASYMHTWINEHQYDDLGEVFYSCGGLRFGKHERGILAPESDLSIAPDLTRSTQMLWFTNFLSRTEYGFITRNEEGDVHPLLRKLLQDKKEAFARLGVDIDAIESRTNI